MPLVCYVSELDKNVSLDAERLLRLLGVSGKLSGFYFAVYMLEQVQEKPEYVLLITKRLYSQTAQYFHTTAYCVERNLRTLVQACWRQPDHRLLERIAGHPLSQPPTNAQFIDMVAAFLRKQVLHGLAPSAHSGGVSPLRCRCGFYIDWQLLSRVLTSAAGLYAHVS